MSRQGVAVCNRRIGDYKSPFLDCNALGMTSRCFCSHSRGKKFPEAEISLGEGLLIHQNFCVSAEAA
jgi:hypothetical protein